MKRIRGQLSTEAFTEIGIGSKGWKGIERSQSLEKLQKERTSSSSFFFSRKSGENPKSQNTWSYQPRQLQLTFPYVRPNTLAVVYFSESYRIKYLSISSNNTYEIYRCFLNARGLLLNNTIRKPNGRIWNQRCTVSHKVCPLKILEKIIETLIKIISLQRYWNFEVLRITQRTCKVKVTYGKYLNTFETQRTTVWLSILVVKLSVCFCYQ